MKRRLIFSFLFFNFCFLTKAQVNLVPNTSFEDTINCPISGNQISYAIPWFNASNGSPDYFNKCYKYSNNVGVPLNMCGYQIPRTGNAYAGISNWFPNQREYIEVQLDSA